MIGLLKMDGWIINIQRGVYFLLYRAAFTTIHCHKLGHKLGHNYYMWGSSLEGGVLTPRPPPGNSAHGFNVEEKAIYYNNLTLGVWTARWRGVLPSPRSQYRPAETPFI